MRKENRLCIVCEKELKVLSDKYNCHMYPTESKEGVCFFRHWYCNDCWNEILNELNKRSDTLETKFKRKGRWITTKRTE